MEARVDHSLLEDESLLHLLLLLSLLLHLLLLLYLLHVLLHLLLLLLLLLHHEVGRTLGAGAAEWRVGRAGFNGLENKEKESSG